MLRIKNWLRAKGLTRANLIFVNQKKLTSIWLLMYYLKPEQRKMIVKFWDPIRYGTVFLALEQISKLPIPGSLAECGVYQGALSKFIHQTLSERPLYLFDSFKGFDQLHATSKSDSRFKDTSVDYVLKIIGDTKNIFIRKGFFPETASGLENEIFAFVMIDFDKYEPTLAALEFFYPRISPGGYIFVHDYNSPESDWACQRALNEFLSDKPEKPIAIPDARGTALFRKI
jgi:O-methyltransferase